MIAKRVSFTQLMTYVRCAEHYLFKYVLNMPRPPRKILKHGFALHETFGYHFEQKKLDKKGLTKNDAKEFFVDVFKNALEEYEAELQESGPFLKLPKEYLAKEKEVGVGELIDLALLGIDVFFKDLNPKIIPDLVETPFNFAISKGVEMTGRIDLADKQGVIHEFKTTRKQPNSQDVAVDPQVAIYHTAYEMLKKKPPKGISKDYLVMSKNNPRIVRFQVAKPSVNSKLILENALSIVEAVKHNIFYCLHPVESWVCSKEWCGYSVFHAEIQRIGLPRFMAKYSKSATLQGV
ncbi:MAG: hypothetical protein A3A24_01645 [Candidatus Buchananbacteria bacterium RIFCSPLOWO2_01_FULL_46_12]|uniref:PD-(D/E)XK endonuclease-like domain-containing protein n=1 Tax=Candidatus Buchananbacteria bacterium RIFCSPLOWO2_01_FULL_46_12 TaxID=1797546 RepID=A0A1G1YQ50_9BACT|nr:MAG: hypothetical protein A3A24_01645 [Candidatus Buchananbacteria bacterium RIFCSPLOWO2_01_FULL_46_12]